MDPMTIGALGTLAGKVFDKMFPSKEEAEKAKLAFAEKSAELEQADIDSFRSFIVAYEGSGDKVHILIQILRGSVRPVLTYALAGAFIYGYINPTSVKSEDMQMLFNLNLLSLGFWFSERALKNLGLDINKWTKGAN